MEIYFERGDNGGEDDLEARRFDAVRVDPEFGEADWWLSKARSPTPTLSPKFFNCEKE